MTMKLTIESDDLSLCVSFDIQSIIMLGKVIEKELRFHDIDYLNKNPKSIYLKYLKQMKVLK